MAASRLTLVLLVPMLAAASPAFADSNITEAEQNGSDNSALIVQGPGDSNEANLLQQGSNNSAEIEQSGDTNLGTDTTDDPITQKGDNNKIDILQSGDSNRVGDDGFVQNGGGTADGDRSEAVIVQSSDGNRIDKIQQTGADGATVAQNKLTVTQQTGNDNRIRDILQQNDGGAINTLTITQTGGRNVLGDTATVAGFAGVVQNGSNNTLSITQAGAGNGSDGATSGPVVVGDFTAGSAAADVGLAQGSARQFGDNNTASYIATGNTNLLALLQDGPGNVAQGTVSGDDNELAILQQGEGNDAVVTQSGNGNDAGVKVLGDDNSSNILQSGGDDNVAFVGLDGDFNEVVIDQSGSLNTASLTVIGNSNGVGTFSGAAAFVATPLTLGTGLIKQVGTGNDVLYEIFGDENVFGFYQSGSGNSIVGSTTGQDNQVAIAQIGDNNVADFSQNGTGNIIGLNQ